MKLSIVIPVFNGAKSIERLVLELIEQFNTENQIEIILVNDYSQDDSWEKLTNLQEKYPQKVIAVNLAKNFGEHNAVMAGYHFCTGNYIINIDDDFQNPPSEIIKLLDKIQEGYDVVYSCYSAKKHNPFRNLGSWLNDKVANIMLNKPNGLYLSSFRIISFQLLKQIIKYKGPYPYIDGLILRNTSNIGQVLVAHHARTEGDSNYTLTKLIKLWSHVFFNFSIIPLRIAIFLGLLFSATGFLGAVAVISEKLIYPETQIGWASIIASVLILSGIQLFMIGIIGEYVGRIFLSQSKTPQFVIQKVLKKEQKTKNF